MEINGKEQLKSGLFRNHKAQKPDLLSARQEKLKTIEFHFAKIMEALGLELDDPSLKETPRRVAKMYIDEVFKGLDERNFPAVSFFENTNGYSDMILVDNIAVYSYCEHHFVPFYGKATVAYIPKNKVIGLSKLNRIVQFYASKPQIQEKLTVEIGQKLTDLLKTDDIAIYIEAHHLCVASRGVKDEHSLTKTSFFGGKFLKNKEKTRFLHAIHHR